MDDPLTNTISEVMDQISAINQVSPIESAQIDKDTNKESPSLPKYGFSEVTYKVNTGTKTMQVKHTMIDGHKVYQCKDCPKNFNKLSGLIRHSRTHSNEKPFQCPECLKCFTLDFNLTMHKKTHLKPKNICSNCSREFVTEKHLLNHMKVHQKIVIFNRDLIAKKSIEDPIVDPIEEDPTGDDLIEFLIEKDHLKDLIEEDPIMEKDHLIQKDPIIDDQPHFECGVCRLIFNCQKSFDLHSHPETVFECGICHMQVSDHIRLKNHLMLHSKEKQFEETSDTVQQVNCSTAFLQQLTDIYSNYEETVQQLELVNFQGPQSPRDEETVQQLELVNFQSPQTLTDEETAQQLDLVNYQSLQTPGDEETVQQLELVNYQSPQTPRDEETVHDDNIKILEDQLGEFIKINDMSAITQCKIPNISVERHDNFSILSVIQETIEEDPDNIIMYDPETEFNPEDLIEVADDFVESKCESEKQKSLNAIVESIFKDDSDPDDLPEKPSVPVYSKHKTCSVCSKLFMKKSDFDRHARTHTNERPFACTKCSKTFSLKCTLIRHELTHKSDRSGLACHLCNKVLATTNSLRLHLQVHQDVKPLGCKYCEMTFRHTTNLQRHERTHLRLAIKESKKPEDVKTRNYNNVMAQRPPNIFLEDADPYVTKSLSWLLVNSKFTCKKCDKGFTQKWSLKRHLKVVHKHTET